MTPLERFLHSLTSWRFYRVPDAERVSCWRDRSEVAGRLPIEWPRPTYAMSTRTFDPSRVGSDGVGFGTPMQTGTNRMRKVTWGYWEWGKQAFGDIPMPVRGEYLTTGYPTPYFDRRCVIACGDVWEMILFDPDAPARDLPFKNQALVWGRFRVGKLEEGQASTAAKLPVSGYVWTPWSKLEPHAQGLVLPDYQGGDGKLTSGPACGDWVALDPDSESYRRMWSLGGECRARADALVKFGARIIDRSGYSDKAQTKPHPAEFHTQQGAQWVGTNVAKFSIALADLRRAV